MENEILGGDVGAIINRPTYNNVLELPTNQADDIRPYGVISGIIKFFKWAVSRNGKTYFSNIPFSWQKAFHDRIIRNERELENIREYIVNNPLNWALDEENPLKNIKIWEERGYAILNFLKEVYNFFCPENIYIYFSNYMNFLPETLPAYISVKVQTGKSKTEFSGKLEDGTIKMNIKSIPEKGKANREIQKFFKKNFKIQVTIKSGSTSSKKLLYLEKII